MREDSRKVKYLQVLLTKEASLTAKQTDVILMSRRITMKRYNKEAGYYEYEVDGEWVSASKIDRDFNERFRTRSILNTVNCSVCGFVHLARWNCFTKTLIDGISSFKN